MIFELGAAGECPCPDCVAEREQERKEQQAFERRQFLLKKKVNESYGLSLKEERELVEMGYVEGEVNPKSPWYRKEVV